MKMKSIIRYCYSKLWNKQCLIFIFFLCLSTIFWIFQALNETYEEEYLIPIELRNVPGNVVITTDLPTALHVTLRDKGSMLLNYRYAQKFSPIVVEFETSNNSSGHVVIQGSELLKQVSRQLMPGTQIVASKPDTLEFYYNYGLCKRVPVVIQGTIHAGKLYSVSGIKQTADSVTVYASKAQLDTITAAYTQPLNLADLTDTTNVQCDFMKIRGAKFVPSRVGVTFCIDRLIEKTVQVPVQQVNFPASKQLRTFPATVKVTFQVGMGLYRDITHENFVIVVNYEDLLKNKSNKCHLAVKTLPAGVSHVRIEPQDVEYIIEELSETEADGENF